MSAARRIDWADLLERTRRAGQAVLDAGTILPEDRDRILRQRAELLSSPLHLRGDADAASTVVIVRSGAERYALPIEELSEVIRQPKITRVPHAPEFVAGLIQVRGEIRPVYHLQVLLGRPASSAPSTVLLVNTTSSAEFGVGVEAVEDMRLVPPESRRPAAVTPGHAGWMTEDLIPCLAANTLIPEQN